MREIKFRAWDKTNKQYYMDGKSFDLNFSGKYGDFFFDNDSPNNMRNLKLEWEQFTGLHDKNGKEIYEGDIVDTGVRSRICIIMFSDGGFTIQGVSKTSVPASNDYFKVFLDEIEVIGNIHENPELLEK